MHAPVAATTKQRAVPLEQGGPDGHATLSRAEPRLLQRNLKHRTRKVGGQHLAIRAQCFASLGRVATRRRPRGVCLRSSSPARPNLAAAPYTMPATTNPTK